MAVHFSSERVLELLLTIISICLVAVAAMKSPVKGLLT